MTRECFSLRGSKDAYGDSSPSPTAGLQRVSRGEERHVSIWAQCVVFSEGHMHGGNPAQQAHGIPPGLSEQQLPSHCTEARIQRCCRTGHHMATRRLVHPRRRPQESPIPRHTPPSGRNMKSSRIRTVLSFIHTHVSYNLLRVDSMIPRISLSVQPRCSSGVYLHRDSSSYELNLTRIWRDRS